MERLRGLLHQSPMLLPVWYVVHSILMPYHLPGCHTSHPAPPVRPLSITFTGCTRQPLRLLFPCPNSSLCLDVWLQDISTHTPSPSVSFVLILQMSPAFHLSKWCLPLSVSSKCGKAIVQSTFVCFFYIDVLIVDISSPRPLTTLQTIPCFPTFFCFIWPKPAFSKHIVNLEPFLQPLLAVETFPP